MELQATHTINGVRAAKRGDTWYMENRQIGTDDMLAKQGAEPEEGANLGSFELSGTQERILQLQQKRASGR
jgi:hypothetical protein